MTDRPPVPPFFPDDASGNAATISPSSSPLATSYFSLSPASSCYSSIPHIPDPGPPSSPSDSRSRANIAGDSSSPQLATDLDRSRTHLGAWGNDSTAGCTSPNNYDKPPARPSSSAPSSPGLSVSAAIVASRHTSLQERFSGARLDDKAPPVEAGSRWTKDESAAARRRYSATSSVCSATSSSMDRCSASIASTSTGNTSLSERSDSPQQPRDPAKDNATTCEVKMPTSPPSMPLYQTPPKECKVEVVEQNDDFVVSVWLPLFNRDLITVSRRRTQALHIVADNYSGPNAGHFERLIELEGVGDEGPSSCVKAEFIAETNTLVIKVLKRRQAKIAKSEKGSAPARERMSQNGFSGQPVTKTGSWNVVLPKQNEECSKTGNHET